MVFFVLVFLSIYTAMHLLVFWGIHPLLAGHPLLPTLNWLWMGLMIFAPLLVRLLDRGGHELPARALAWIGYTWMGFIFLAFCLCTLLAGWELLAWALGRIWPTAANLSVHGGLSAGLIVVVALAAGLYGIYEAGQLRVETVRLATAKLPPGSKGLRIVQVSDLHLGLIDREDTLAPVVAKIQQLQPDLVLATGDVVDAQINHLEELSGLWRQVQPPLGKFAVTGNHEVYAGLGQALDFLDASGFQVLRGASTRLSEQLALVGVDDPADRPDRRRSGPAGTGAAHRVHHPAQAPAAGRSGGGGPLRPAALRPRPPRPDLPLQLSHRPGISAAGRPLSGGRRRPPLHQPRHRHLGTADAHPLSSRADGLRHRPGKRGDARGRDLRAAESAGRKSHLPPREFFKVGDHPPFSLFRIICYVDFRGLETWGDNPYRHRTQAG